MPAQSPMTRRSFLGTLAATWVGLLSLPVLKGILDYLSPAAASTLGPSAKTFALRWDQLVPNSAKVLKLDNKPVMLVKTSGGQLKAFSARCTHLGCIVQYKGDAPAPHFECNCHGSRFDANGVNIAGPAPRPLDRFKVEVDGNDVFVLKV